MYQELGLLFVGKWQAPQNMAQVIVAGDARLLTSAAGANDAKFLGLTRAQGAPCLQRGPPDA
ncbi:MAG: hypothetical protein KJO42_01065 [Silicimonas sp.]|nr:hypothetical protein [Silicimonas sp.]NND19942.1 hypothetical protein [Silicimonas sp.]NND21224.1 hypothetical protein [Silicimonas sp.]NNL72612.1 hypothetical protein [Silicimonas sp.]RZW11477.1 MAG: hypothetical protein EX266_02455 [Paracoccaceae bacterium]